MKNIELTLCIAAFLSLKWILIFMLPGGGLLVTLFLTLLSTFYFWLSFALFNGIGFSNIFNRQSYKGISSKKIIGAIGTGFFLSITILGVLFKIMFWPGANFNLTFGISGLIIISVIGYIKYLKSRLPYYTILFKRIIVTLVIAIFFLSIPSAMIIKIRYRNHSEYANALIQSNEQPENQKLQDKREEEFRKSFPE